MKTDTEVSPPEGLGEPSESLFRELAALVPDLDAADGEILAEIAQAHHRLQQINEAIEGDGLLSTGSKQQPTAHPLLGIEIQVRTSLVASVRIWRDSAAMRRQSAMLRGELDAAAAGR